MYVRIAVALLPRWREYRDAQLDDDSRCAERGPGVAGPLDSANIVYAREAMSI